MTAGASGVSIEFSDGSAYDQFMGRWSQAAGAAFLDWLRPASHAHWLEIGCGTGAFTDLVLRTCCPTAIVATDPAPAQVETAKRRLAGQNVDFQIAGAYPLSFQSESFDVIVGALVLNFITDRRRALCEMRRVGRPGALVAAYVWDFAADRAPNSSLALGLRHMGLDVPAVPGTDCSTLASLRLTFEQAGFDEIDVTQFDVALEFPNFDAFWQALTPGFSPLTNIIAALSSAEMKTLTTLVKRQVGASQAVRSSARANAIKARVP